MLLDKAPKAIQSPEQLKKFIPKSRAERAKLLLVEDDPSNILVESIFLDEGGYHYEIASSGHEVLKKVIANSYSLILMDITLPDMSGLEVTRKLRQMEKQGLVGHIPIIAMTAHAISGYREKCLNEGMNEYLSKPFSQEQLHKKIEQTINSK